MHDGMRSGPLEAGATTIFCLRLRNGEIGVVYGEISSHFSGSDGGHNVC